MVLVNEWGDDELVGAVAADYVARYGPAALQHLRKMEEAARSMGDAFSAATWSDIARSAAEQAAAEKP